MDSASQRTTYPSVTGGSVVALKYNGGVLVAADTIMSYGTLAKFDGVVRMAPVGAKGQVLLSAGGDYSDFQQMLKIVNSSAVEEYTMDDGAVMSASAMHHWLTRIMYQRRSKMDPLWNALVLAGVSNGQSYLGTTDMYGTMYADNFIATGMGAHLALPLLRKAWKPDLTEAEARKVLEDCMRVCFYRSCTASNKITIGKASGGTCVVSDIVSLETFWEHPEFVRGGIHDNSLD